MKASDYRVPVVRSADCSTLDLTLWAVWVDHDHIHTDVEGKLAVFRGRRAAERWVKEFGGPNCSAKKLKPE